MDRSTQYQNDDVWSDTDSSESAAESAEFSHQLVHVDEFDAL